MELGLTITSPDPLIIWKPSNMTPLRSPPRTLAAPGIRTAVLHVAKHPLLFHTHVQQCTAVSEVFVWNSFVKSGLEVKYPLPGTSENFPHSSREYRLPDKYNNYRHILWIYDMAIIISQGQGRPAVRNHKTVPNRTISVDLKPWLFRCTFYLQRHSNRIRKCEAPRCE